MNIAGTSYYLCAVLDGYSRATLHWEIRESMKEVDVETILQRAREKYPPARPRVISDDGLQFIARDFKEFIRIAGMTHVRTSPYYPHSTGKAEAWHNTVKAGAIRIKQTGTLEEARRGVGEFVEHYNNKRLHSASGTSRPRQCSLEASRRSAPSAIASSKRYASSDAAAPASDRRMNGLDQEIDACARGGKRQLADLSALTDDG